MNNHLLGLQIAKYRKDAGLTQEELSKTVGVSTQAVSRWECGGTPDVSLLPAIADRLGVTIDALFGREGGSQLDMSQAVDRWLISQPEGKKIDSLCRLLWKALRPLIDAAITTPELNYLEHAELKATEEAALLRAYILLDDGLVFGVGAEDLSFMTLFPEPGHGWGAYLLEADAYRSLFSCLAKPGCLELLEHLFRVESRYYVPGVVARQINCSTEDAAENMAALAQLGLLTKLDLELEEGHADAYQVRDNGAFIPFLYLARCLIQKNDSYILLWQQRKAPPLRTKTSAE